MPRPGGASSSYLVRTPNTAALLDIGSGAVGKLQLGIAYAQLDAIVISHMHADHFFDLVPLRYALKYGETGRSEPLAVWLPPGGRGALEALRKAVAVDAPLDFFDGTFAIQEYDATVPLDIKELRLSFRRTRHYVEAYAMRAECDGVALTYSADTAPCEPVVELARDSALFLCEAGLGLASEEGERGHSSAQEAGEMAQRAGAARLLLTHYPSKWAAGALIAAAQRRFAGPVSAAEDGMQLNVP
jgi:ribonuclease BN (tRNA processing enzyme)